ncbi:MAG: Ethanolamine ammonia-lyase heavy chain, partial [uncultured Phycisphaerae bacterium]
GPLHRNRRRTPVRVCRFAPTNGEGHPRPLGRRPGRGGRGVGPRAGGRPPGARRRRPDRLPDGLVGPVRGRRGHPADRRHPRPSRVRANEGPDGRAVPRVAARLRTDCRRAGGRRPGRDAGDGRGRLEADAEPGPRAGRRQVPGGDAVPLHARAERPAGRAGAAEPPDRRPGRHHGRGDRRADVRLRRRVHRRQPGDRQRPRRHRPAARAGRADRPVPDPDPELRAGPRNDGAAVHRGRRADRPRVPIGRRHRGGQHELRRVARAAGRGARRRPRHRAGPGRRERDVLRDRPGVGAVGRGAPRGRPADARGPGVRGRPAVRPAAGEHGRRVHRPRVPVRRQADHPGRAGGPLLRQAARAADGVRRLLHEPHRRRPGRHGQPAHPARGGRVQLRHGRARGGRRDARVPEHQLPRRPVPAAVAGPAAGPGVRGVAGAHAGGGRDRPIAAAGRARAAAGR